MPVLRVVIKMRGAAILKVNKRQQAVLDIQLVQYQTVLKCKIDCHENLDAHHLSPKKRGLVRLKGCCTKHRSNSMKKNAQSLARSL